jgi:general secretion pathway protein G
MILDKNCMTKKISNEHFSLLPSPFSFQEGFTLIELLVVIAIIGILTALSTVNYIAVKARARDAQRKSDLHQIQAALELYRSDQGGYPATNEIACGQPLSAANVTYMQKIPCDPSNVGQLVYTYVVTGNGYNLIACLENVNDTQKDATNDTNHCSGTSNWSYTLTNP